MKIKIVITLLLMVCASDQIVAQRSAGLTKGSLILTGGDIGKSVIERFVELAGGHGAPHEPERAGAAHGAVGVVDESRYLPHRFASER